MKKHLDSAGSSLVESMIAFVIIAGAAVAIFPLFTVTKQANQLGDVKMLCNNYVRGKINEYIQGRPVSIEAEPVDVRTRLEALSSDSLSLANVEVNLDPNIAPEVTASGFYYTKVRYNKYFPYSCAGRPSDTSVLVAGNPPEFPNGLPPDMLQLGMRECIGTDVAWDEPTGETPDPEGQNNCTSPLDAEARRLLPGFKLYVRLQLATPWNHMAPPAEKWPVANNGLATPLLVDQGDATHYKDDQYSVRCPNFGSWDRDNAFGPNVAAYSAITVAAPGAALYDFDGADDAVEVTVTGVIDLGEPGLQNIESVAGLADPFRLYCQSSVIVRPMRYPVRYYVTNNGWIHTVHGRAHNRGDENDSRMDSTDDDYWAFPSLYASGATRRISNILSVSVHPRNFAAYVLRPGSITRYGNCGGVPIDCNPINHPTEGIRDDGVIGVRSVQEWRVPAAIRHLSVNFGARRANGEVVAYGMSEGQTVDDGNAPIAQRSKGFYFITLTPGQADAVVEQVPMGVFPAPMLQGTERMAPRLTGFFISPGGQEAFITDPSSSEVLGRQMYKTTIYKIDDLNLEQPVAVMPFSGISFSK